MNSRCCSTTVKQNDAFALRLMAHVPQPPVKSKKMLAKNIKTTLNWRIQRRTVRGSDPWAKSDELDHQQTRGCLFYADEIRLDRMMLVAAGVHPYVCSSLFVAFLSFLYPEASGSVLAGPFPVFGRDFVVFIAFPCSYWCGRWWWQRWYCCWDRHKTKWHK